MTPYSPGDRIAGPIRRIWAGDLTSRKVFW